jgi:hypothetical protein
MIQDVIPALESGQREGGGGDLLPLIVIADRHVNMEVCVDSVQSAVNAENGGTVYPCASGYLLLDQWFIRNIYFMQIIIVISVMH